MFMMMMNQMAGGDVYYIYYTTSNNANVRRACSNGTTTRGQRISFLNEDNFYRYTIDEFGNAAAGNRV